MKKGLIIFLLFVLIGTSLLIYQKYNRQKIVENDLIIVEKISKHYNTYVKTIKETYLYTLNNNIYNEKGVIGKNVEITLSQQQINPDTLYFHIEQLDAYIKYEDVTPILNISLKDETYKKYIVFNQNILTKSPTSFYDQKGLVYKLNESFSLPIIIKETDRYYIEYNNNLLYVLKENVESLVDINNTQEKVRDNIRTLAYHFVYKKGEKCLNKYICHSDIQFIEHMKYINSNNYFSLKMKDLALFLDSKIRIPEKSIVITLDDGYLLKNAIEILENYKVNATYFIVTSWNDVSNIKSDFVEFHSHTDNMHNNYKCPGGNQGSQLLCDNKQKIIEDLKISQSKLNNSKIFCYPFYDYNNYIINILKYLGFKMAFVGENNEQGLSNKNTNKMRLPRMTISSYTTMKQFIDLLK
ncbi:MAG: polysaccharide deacetylase family protein [Bacilli bacterium]